MRARKKPILISWSWVTVVVLATALSGLGAEYAGWAVGGIANGYGTILHTSNSGATWERQGAGMIADGDVAGISALDPSTAWAVGSAVNGYSAIYRTTDGGQSWTRMGSQSNLPTADLFKVNALYAQHVWAVGPGAILHTSDAGTNWVNQVPAGFGGLSFQGIFTPDGTNVWATGAPKDGYATILKSTDAGQSWVRQGGDAVTNVDHLLGVAATDGNHAWAVGGLGNNVLKTTDGGTSWQMMDQGGTYDANELAVITANDVWVAHDSAVRWTHDGGQTWSNHNTATYTLGIAVTDATNAWAVATGAMGQGIIYHTRDGGTNWEEQTVTGGTPAGLRTVSFASQSVPQASWSFAMLGDTRGDRDTTTNGISPYLNAIAQKIATLSPDLVLVCGDLVNGDDVPTNSPLADYALQFTNWMTAMQPVYNYTNGTGIPIYPVRGNHENCDHEGPTVKDLKKAYYQAFKSCVPTNGPNYGLTNDQTGFTYSFTHRNVTFVVADQYFYYNEAAGDSGYHDLARAWVSQQFQQANSPYKIFMAHEPIFNSESAEPGGFFGNNAAALQTREQFWNALGTNGVQLYLTAHIHNETVARTTDDYGNPIFQLVAGNGGAPLEAIGGSHEPGVDVQYTNSLFGFSLATVAADALTIQYYSLNTNNNSWTVADYVTRLGTTLKISRVADNLNLSWIGGGTLQSATNLTPVSPWTDVTTNGAWSEPTSNSARFFRVKK